VACGISIIAAATAACRCCVGAALPGRHRQAAGVYAVWSVSRAGRDRHARAV